MYEAAEVIHSSVLDDAIVIFGSVVDDRIQGEIQITVIATGFGLQPTGEQKKAEDPFSMFFTAGNGNASSFKKKATQETANSMLDIPEFLRKSY